MPPMNATWTKTISRAQRRFRPVATAVLAVLLIAMLFGISPDDEAALRTFQAAAWRWQSNPEYRSIAVEYCILADSALRTRAFLIRGPSLVVATRSLPFAPHRY